MKDVKNNAGMTLLAAGNFLKNYTLTFWCRVICCDVASIIDAQYAQIQLEYSCKYVFTTNLGEKTG